MGLFSSAKCISIGSGVSGSVDLKFKNHKYYVVKTYHSKESFELKKEYHERVLHEFRVLDLLHQENFIQVHRYKVLMNGLTVKMYMEAGTEDMAALLKRNSQSEVSITEILCIWKQLCNGIAYLHSQGLCHRDLKLDNMVMSRENNHLKIIDLATALDSFDGHKSVGIVGSKSYMAPETYSQISYDGKAADVWSVAIVLVYMCTRLFPWASAVRDNEKFVEYRKAREEHEQKCNGNDEIDVIDGNDGTDETDENKDLGGLTNGLGSFIGGLKGLPRDSTGLIMRMLTVEPEKRIKMEDVIEDLWLQHIRCCHDNMECGQEHVLR